MKKITDIHVALPETLVTGLDRVARERCVRRAHLLREAVIEFLERVEAERIEREMTNYANTLASHSKDFTTETDAHTIQRLLMETKW